MPVFDWTEENDYLQEILEIPGTLTWGKVQESCGRPGAFVSELFDIKTDEQTERISMAGVSSGSPEAEALQMESQLCEEPKSAALDEPERTNKLQVLDGD